MDRQDERNKRNLEYEKKFRHYLFKGNFERHKEICKNLNVKPNIPKRAERGRENEVYK